MEKVLKKLLKFRKERSWEKYHSPQNIAKSIVLEAAEIMEVFQWKQNSKLSESEKKHLAEEMADVFNWLILLSHDLEIDLIRESLTKIDSNSIKYPIVKSKGKYKKYTEL